MGLETTTQARPRAIFAALLLLLVAPAAASADALTLTPAGSDVAPIELTLEELAALPQTTVRTENEFVDGTVEYRGPLARDVLAPLAVDRASVLRFTAANDYAVDVPATDLLDFDVILAMEADGRKLSLRDKGPLWLMYPISDHPPFRGRPYTDRLIWQVVSVEVQ
jgi:hypothetical protein